MRAPELDAVLPVDKPAGRTSHDIVALARRALGTRRIGHTGTLDPFATGLLLLCIGRATRLAEYLGGLRKTYEATLRLGAATATDDATGAVVTTSEAWRTLEPAALERAFAAQTGRLMQRPPTFSAKKVEGERAYHLARRGDALELAPVEVHVHALELLETELPDVRFRVTVSAGTYIRAIARDVGEALGVGGHLTALRRRTIGAFDVADAVSGDRLGDPEAVARARITPLAALRHLPRVDLDAAQADAVRHGRRVQAAVAVEGAVVLAADDVLVAVADARQGVLQPRKVFVDD